MIIMKVVLNLTRPAKSKGGDRYEVTLVEGENPLVIYLPQSITRPSGGKPLSKINMELSTEENKEA